MSQSSEEQKTASRTLAIHWLLNIMWNINDAIWQIVKRMSHGGERNKLGCVLYKT